MLVGGKVVVAAAVAGARRRRFAARLAPGFVARRFDATRVLSAVLLALAAVALFWDALSRLEVV
jgi:hypothetical protein